MTRSVLLITPLLLIGSLVEAREIPFETIDFTNPDLDRDRVECGEFVIRNAKQLRARGLDQLVDPSHSIDFRRQMILAVVGPHAPEIRSVLTSSFGGPCLIVNVRRDSSTRSWGYHLIKLRRQRQRVRWDESPGERDLDLRVLIQHLSRQRVRTIDGQEILREITIEVLRNHYPLRARFRLRHGPRSALRTHEAELSRSTLQAITNVLRRQRVHRIPPQLPGTPGERFRLRVRGFRDAGVQGVVGQEGRYYSRLKPLWKVLDDLEDRFAPPALVFDWVGYTGERAIRINRWGRVEVARPGREPARGWAVGDELQRLSKHVRQARIMELQRDTSPVGFTLQIDAPVRAHRGFLSGNQTDPALERLKPMIDLIETIGRRVAGEPVPFRTIVRRTRAGRPEARIEVDGRGRVFLLPGDDRGLPRMTRATTRELRILRLAIQRAGLADVPNDLPKAVGPRFTLELEHGDPVHEVRFGGRLGHYGPWAARVEPVMDALDAIVNRLSRRSGLRSGGALGNLPD